MKKSVLLFALCMYIFAGCNQEPQDVIDQEDCQVEISFNNDFTKSLLKSTTTAEGAMSKVILFGVDIAGNYVQKYTIDAPIVGTQSKTILKSIHTLYAIANPTSTIEGLTPSKAQLDVLTTSFASAPATPLLMGGSADIVKNSGVYTVTIQLIRSMAKVVFTSTDTDLTITSVKATNTPDLGYVLKQGSAAAVPGTANLISTYTGVAGTDGSPVYVAENTNASDALATNFIVTGEYNGKTANYTLILKTGATRLAIERNKQYNVSISPSNETSCDITISMPDWEDVNAGGYVIPDTDFH